MNFLRRKRRTGEQQTEYPQPSLLQSNGHAGQSLPYEAATRALVPLDLTGVDLTINTMRIAQAVEPLGHDQCLHVTARAISWPAMAYIGYVGGRFRIARRDADGVELYAWKHLTDEQVHRYLKQGLRYDADVCRPAAPAIHWFA